MTTTKLISELVEENEMLLEACKLALFDSNYGMWTDQSLGALQQAIAKAEGNDKEEGEFDPGEEEPCQKCNSMTHTEETCSE